MSDNGKRDAQDAPPDQSQRDQSQRDPSQRDPNNGPPAFDWVTERSHCSLPRIFAALRSQIEQDVKTRNSLRPRYAPYEFSVTEDNGELTVHLRAKELQRSVTFRLSLEDHAVLIRDNEGNRLFDVATRFDDTGKCRLMVNGEERDFWQVRRMALEDLMFTGL